MSGTGPSQNDACHLDECSDRSERLLYLADMAGELKVLAERDGCRTLSTLLELAHAEALMQAGQRE